MDAKDKNLNDRINLLDIKLEKNLWGKSKGTSKGMGTVGWNKWKNNSYFPGLEKKRQVKKL